MGDSQKRLHSHLREGDFGIYNMISLGYFNSGTIKIILMTYKFLSQVIYSLVMVVCANYIDFPLPTAAEKFAMRQD